MYQASITFVLIVVIIGLILRPAIKAFFDNHDPDDKDNQKLR